MLLLVDRTCILVDVDEPVELVPIISLPEFFNVFMRMINIRDIVIVYKSCD